MGNLNAFPMHFLKRVVLFVYIGHEVFVDWGMVDATGMVDKRMSRCQCILSLLWNSVFGIYAGRRISAQLLCRNVTPI